MATPGKRVKEGLARYYDRRGVLGELVDRPVDFALDDPAVAGRGRPEGASHRHALSPLLLAIDILGPFNSAREMLADLHKRAARYQERTKATTASR